MTVFECAKQVFTTINKTIGYTNKKSPFVIEDYDLKFTRKLEKFEKYDYKKKVYSRKYLHGDIKNYIDTLITRDKIIITSHFEPDYFSLKQEQEVKKEIMTFIVSCLNQSGLWRGYIA